MRKFESKAVGMAMRELAKECIAAGVSDVSDLAPEKIVLETPAKFERSGLSSILTKLDIDTESATYIASMALIDQTSRSMDHVESRCWMLGSMLRFLNLNPDVSLKDYLRIIYSEIDEVEQNIDMLNERHVIYDLND